MALYLNNKRFLVLATIILLTALTRLLPHPPNFSPVAAIALFGGAYFVQKKWAFILPLFAMFISDIGLELITGHGFHTLMPVVYIAFTMTVGLGLLIGKRVNIGTVIGGTLAASILFFVLTNFAVWIQGGLYPLTFEGLITCYVAAIPFFGNTLLGNVVYASILFGGWALAESKLPAIARPQIANG